jgi:hypothetical protein
VDVLVVAVAVVAALLVGGSVGFVMQKKLTRVRAEADTLKAESLLEDAQRDADALRKEAELQAKEQQLRLREETEEQLELRRSEIARAEERAPPPNRRPPRPAPRPATSCSSRRTPSCSGASRASATARCTPARCRTS